MSEAEAQAAEPQAPEAVPEVQHGSTDREAAKVLAERRKRATRNAIQHMRESSAEPAADQGQPDETERIADAKSQGQDQDDPQVQEASETESEGDGDTGATSFPTRLTELAEALEVDAGDLAQALTVTRRVNGHDEEISIADAVEGTLRQSDYSRLTNELAQSRKEFETERESALERAKQQDEMVQTWLGVVANALQAGPSDAELNSLLQTDPDRYHQLVAHRNSLNTAFQQVQAQRQMQMQEAQKNAETARSAAVLEQREVLSRMSQNKASGIPNPHDAQKWSAFEGEMRQYLGNAGFTPQDVEQFLQPGNWQASQIKVIADAMYGQSLRQKGGGVAKKVKHLPKPLKPGSPKDRATSNREKIDAARKRLQRNSSGQAGVDNAVALLRAKRAAR